MERFLFCLTVLVKFSSAFAEDCSPGHYYKARRGNITNMEYPLIYPSNACEAWYITGDIHDIITISISHMNILPDVDGSCGKYYIRIGQEPMKMFCGDQRQVYVSKSGHVVIKYTSPESSYWGLGFTLKYIMGPLHTVNCKYDEFRCVSNGKCIYKSWLCNGLSECEDGSDEISCVESSTKTTTTTTTTTTMLPPSSALKCPQGQIACMSRKTRIYECLPITSLCDGKTDCYLFEDELATNCPPKSCNKFYDADTGYIMSPLYPHDYPNNYDCQWIIHIRDTSATIQLRFNVFNLQSGVDTDYVVIYDGTDTTAPILGNQKYYGKAYPPVIMESSSNWVVIKFHSDSSVPEKGFNLTYQKKGVCLSSQHPCGNGEIDCYDKSQGCDGVWDCKRHGGDEKGCGNCKPAVYSCGPKSSQCYEEKERCNGRAHCSDKADEFNCTSIQCGSHNGTFLCDNKHCIYETWRCDKTNDCDDSSDETNCPHSTNLIKIAAVAGSLICSLVLVVALGCTCKLYNLRMQQFHGPRYETPLSRLYAEFMRRRAPPPYHEAMLTSRPYEEARREYLEQLAGNVRPNSRHGRRGRRRPSRGRSHLQQVNETDHTSSEIPADASTQNVESSTQQSNDIQILAASGGDNSTNRTHVNIDRQSSQTALINNSDSDGISSESDLDNGQSEGVQVEFSDEAGLSAHWRRSNRIKQDSDSEQESTSQQIQPNNTSGDVCSIDNTIASCDSVDSPKTDNEDDKNTEENINICDTNNPASSNSNNREQLRHHQSQDSLNSSGSESTSWGDFVA